MPELLMPSLGADMTAGTLVEWMVAPGDVVHRGDTVAAVDTDKAEIEIETFHDGVIGELLVHEGEHVPVGTPLATILAPAEAPAGAGAPPAPTPVAPSATHAPTPVAPQASAPPAPQAPTPVVPPAAPGRLRVSPLARRAAADLGVDLATVRGTGPHGSVVRSDVERAARPADAVAAPAPVPEPAPPAPPPSAPPAPADRAAAMREAIGRLMTRSAREIPHYHLGTHIDLHRALDALARRNADRPVTRRVLPAAMLLRAVALAATDVPQLNGFWEDDRFRPAEGVHLGVAIALRGGGLVAPAIRDADRLELDDLMDALRDLVHRTRQGRLRGSEMTDATLTVTNLGDQGAETVHGVIYPPQVALVGFGRIAERPWAADGLVGARPVVSATLAADHRASDGHLGGLLLAAIDRRLQEPDAL